MTQCYIQCDETLPVKCDDCDWTGTAGQTEMISDIQERLTPGGVVPAGQCPECGALAYPIQDGKEAAKPDDSDDPQQPELVELARSVFADGSDNDIEVDDDAALSHGNDGIWVQAWVLLKNDVLRENGLSNPEAPFDDEDEKDEEEASA